jgi:hypothetical protein
LPFDERPPRGIFVRGIDRQNLSSLFPNGRSIQDVHSDFRDLSLPCRKRMVTDLSDRNIPCCLGFFPVSGLPDARFGASLNSFEQPNVSPDAAGHFIGPAIRSWDFGD